MNKQVAASALAAALAIGPLASPALADGAASTRNIFVGIGAGIAGAIGITNYNHKKRLKQQEEQEQARRQSSYKAYFYRKYGYYPTPEQIRDWYYRTYGVEPSTS